MPAGLAVLSMELVSEDQSYERAAETAAFQMEDLRKRVAKAGHMEKEMKTSLLLTEPIYQTEKEGNTQRQSLWGYRVRNSLELAFPFTPKSLQRTMSEVAEAAGKPRIQVSFRAEDPSVLKKELLKQCAADARETAEALAEASGVHLGALQSIQCPSAGGFPPSPTMYRSGAAMMAKAVPDVNPKEVEVEEEALFVYEILDAD